MAVATRLRPAWVAASRLASGRLLIQIAAPGGPDRLNEPLCVAFGAEAPYAYVGAGRDRAIREYEPDGMVALESIC